MLGAWLRAEDATRRDMRRMRLISRALRGIPVSFLVKRAEETAERVSKLLPDAKPHKRCLKKAASLHEQVKSLGPCLQQSAGTLQHLLYLTRALPLLRQFHDRLRECGVLDEHKHHQPSPPPHTEPADAADEAHCGGGELCVSALYCGGPLWTRLTAEVCHHRCRPQRLAHMLAALPKRLLLSLSLSASPEPAAARDRDLSADLERELGLKLEPPKPPEPPEPRGVKRVADHSPTRNPLIGMMEDEDDLPPIKIPQLDPSLFKPLLD